MEEYLDAGIDGSGEKSTKRGGWMRERWKVRKGWIKIVIIDVKGKKGKYVIDIRAGSESLDERAVARGMIRKNNKNIKVLFADGLHENEDMFDLCEKHDIPTAIKLRDNCSVKTKSPRRKQEAGIYKSMPYKEWAREKDYRQR